MSIATVSGEPISTYFSEVPKFTEWCYRRYSSGNANQLSSVSPPTAVFLLLDIIKLTLFDYVVKVFLCARGTHSF